MTPDHHTILARAATAAGTTLTDPVDLGGSQRTTVLRASTATGDTVIVKAHHEHTDQFTAEAAGLAFTTRGPQLLAVDTEHTLIVMSDLGTGPTLADHLLGDSPTAAAQALLAWATEYGRIAAETHGRQAEFHRLGPEPDTYDIDTEAVHTALDALGVPPPPDLTDEYAQIDAIGGPQVFSPGDVCPDNNITTADGLHVIDFEGAGYHSVYFDAAYTRMPFSTCWCVYRLPPGLADRIETAYRTQVTAAWSELADDTTWQHGTLLATAYWTLHITGILGARAATADLPMHSKQPQAPTARQVLRHRWTHLAERADPTLPTLGRTMRGLLAATEQWPVAPLPRYPAFTPRPPTTVTS